MFSASPFEVKDICKSKQGNQMYKLKCKHKKAKFLGIMHHTQYPEKCFLCETCRQVITDYITTEEMVEFNHNNQLSIEL